MNELTQSIREMRTFVPAKDYEISRQFYSKLGFGIAYDDGNLAVLNKDGFSFYLQNYYNEDWANNFMMLAEVADVDQLYKEMRNLQLEDTFESVRFTELVDEDWGRVFRMHDPSGVLWHFATFNN